RIKSERMATGAVFTVLDRLHVLAGPARRHQFPRRKAFAGILPGVIKSANVLDPALTVRVGLGRVRAVLGIIPFRRVAVRAGELDGLVVLAVVTEPLALLGGFNLADRHPLATRGQDNALGQVVLVVELEFARVLFLVAKQLELGMVVAESTDL